MSLLTYLLILLLSYIGILAGYIILLLAPEEKKPGMKYFYPLNIGLFLVFVVLMVWAKFEIISVVLALASVLLFFRFKNFQIHTAYIFFGLSYFLLSDNAYFIIFPVLIFMYGLVSGAMLFDLKNKKKAFFTLFYTLHFFIIAAIAKIVMITLTP
jgi:hypothetical protein